jgi:tetratricopeptide (TPR) repeat protein
MTRAIKLLVALAGAITPFANARDEGAAAFAAGHYSVALEKLKQASPQDSVAQAYLGLTYAALADCPAALPKLTSVAEQQGDLYRLTNLAAAKCYHSSGDSSRAFAILDHLEHVFPNDADVLYLSARLHMKSFNEATFAMFQKSPGSYRVHELSAEIFEVQNRYPEAVDEYRKAIALNPAAADLHFRLGRALLLQSHEKAALEQAAAEFRAELKVSPEDGACEFQLGQIAQVQGNTPDAKSHFERALALSPSFVQAMIALGKIETQQQQWPRAIALLARAVELQPANETAHYALLTAYRNAGDLEKAKQEKDILDRLQKPPEGEFSDFLKRLGEKKPEE